MKPTHRHLPSLLASACALVFGVAATSSLALAQAAPFTLTDAPAATITPSSPLMMSAAAVDAQDDWHFRLSVPIWLPGMSGDMTVRGHELSGGRGSGSDFFDNLDFAGALHFEAEKGQWGVFVDTMYVSFSDDKDLRTGGTAEATAEGFIGELGGFYTLVAPTPGVKGWGMFRTDLLAGVRVAWIELGAETPRFDVTRDCNIVDPIIGARMELGLTDWLSYKLRGDIGGFGLDPGTTSNFSWNIDTGLEFHLAKWFDVDLGYRWLSYDFKNGDSDLDAMLDGPYVTLQFRF